MFGIENIFLPAEEVMQKQKERLFHHYHERIEALAKICYDKIKQAEISSGTFACIVNVQNLVLTGALAGPFELADFEDIIPKIVVESLQEKGYRARYDICKNEIIIGWERKYEKNE